MPNAEAIRRTIFPDTLLQPQNFEIDRTPEIIIPHTAFLFPGQGVQNVGMGKDLYQKSKAAKEVFDTANDVLGFNISALCFEGPLESLTDSVNIQPAIVTTSLAYAAALQEQFQTIQSEKMAFLPDVVVGHSLGEYAAFVAAGVLSPENAIRISRKRGELMHQASNGELTQDGSFRRQGMGVITGWNEEKVENFLTDFEGSVFLANVNSEKQIIISGYADAVDLALEEAERLRARTGRISVPIAAHSPLMQPAVEPFREFLEHIEFHDPRTKLILNMTNQVCSDREKIKESLSHQLTHGVNWQTTMQTLHHLGTQRYIEVGPGKVLSGLIKKGNPDLNRENISHAVDFLEETTDSLVT